MGLKAGVPLSEILNEMYGIGLRETVTMVTLRGQICITVFYTRTQLSQPAFSPSMDLVFYLFIWIYSIN